jgi:hypothetical protein
MRRRWHSLLFAVALLATTEGAKAGDVARARQIFGEGVRRYQAGDFEGALRLFRQADEEHHAAAITYNMGLAEEKLGHLHAALEAYETYLQEAGPKADLATAATEAAAQIKARTTRLMIETRPPGGTVLVDGTKLRYPAPTSVVVPAGQHQVRAEGDGWSNEREVTARGVGDGLILILERPEQQPPPPVAKASEEPSSLSPARPLPAPMTDGDRAAEERPSGPDGLVWGATFAITPAYMLGVTTAGANNATGGLSIVAGPVLELGYALTEKVEFLGRALFGIGPDGKPSYAYMGGPGLSYHAGPVWLGATFIGGQLETRVHGVRYGTDIVFGGMLEANVVVIDKPQGQWLAGVQPSMLLTEMRQDNTAFFVPLSFGYRSY